MVGGGGVDRLYGAAGRDRLFTVDGHPGDRVIGGSGRDQCFGDPGDRLRCEVKFRGATLPTAKALSQAFGGQALTAEELIAPTVAPTVPPPVVVTVTETETIPANCGGHPAPPPIC